MRLLILTIALIMLSATLIGCSGRTTSQICGNSTKTLFVDQVPVAAKQVALQFADALYTYNTKQLQNLSEPELRGSVLHEAFNGPNASPIRVVKDPEITQAVDCGTGIKVTIVLRAQQAGYQVNHTLWLTLRANGNTWRVAQFAADYDSPGT